MYHHIDKYQNFLSYLNLLLYYYCTQVRFYQMSKSNIIQSDSFYPQPTTISYHHYSLSIGAHHEATSIWQPQLNRAKLRKNDTGLHQPAFRLTDM